MKNVELKKQTEKSFPKIRPDLLDRLSSKAERLTGGTPQPQAATQLAA